MKQKLNDYFHVSYINSKEDLTEFSLLTTILGFNDRIWKTSGSYNLSSDDRDFFKNLGLSDEELEIPYLVRIKQMQIVTRNKSGEYEDFALGFDDSYEFITKHVDEYDLIYITESDDVKPIYLPIGSNMLAQASNYAFQWIQSLSFESFCDVEKMAENNIFLKKFTR